MSATSRHADEVQSRKPVKLRRSYDTPLPSLDDMSTFGRAFDEFGGVRLVLLGEASDRTFEFYRVRGAITRWLIEQHGFKIVAVEADLPDAARVDRYVRHLI